MNIDVTISIHALLTESDAYTDSEARSSVPISIHALLTESDLTRPGWVSPASYFYPRSPYGERPNPFLVRMSSVWISIHALLTESDAKTINRNIGNSYFYPRSPYGERPDIGLVKADHLQFLSTLSLRRATSSGDYLTQESANFYPRSPYGERLNNINSSVTTADISIHALLTESDLWVLRKVPILGIFLSTLSLRRATIIKIRFRFRLPKFLSTLSLRRATQ